MMRLDPSVRTRRDLIDRSGLLIAFLVTRNRSKALGRAVHLGNVGLRRETMNSHLRDQDQAAQPPALPATSRAGTPADRTLARRSFLRRSVAAAGAVSAAATLPGAQHKALAQFSSGHLFPGDAAILRFLAAAEILESDL